MFLRFYYITVKLHKSILAVCPKDRPAGDDDLSVSKILLTIYGMVSDVGGYTDKI